MFHQQRDRLSPRWNFLEAVLLCFELDRWRFAEWGFVERFVEGEIVAYFGLVSAALLAAALFTAALFTAALDGRPRLLTAAPILTSLALASATTPATPAAAPLFAFRRLASGFRTLRFRPVLATRRSPLVETCSKFISLLELRRARRRPSAATREPFFPVSQIAGLRLRGIQTKRGEIRSRPHVFVFVLLLQISSL